MKNPPPRKPCPDRFREVFIRDGWRGVEAEFGSRTNVNVRWVHECGGEELKRERRAYRNSLRKVRPSIRRLHEKPEPPQAVAPMVQDAIAYLRSPEGGNWPITATGTGDFYFGNSRKSGDELIERAIRKGFHVSVDRYQAVSVNASKQ